MSTAGEDKLLNDFGMVNCAAELLNETISIGAGEKASAELARDADPKKDGKGVIIHGVTLESKQLQLIRKTFHNMKVIGRGTPEDDPPEAVQATGELEVLRAAIELSIQENIECGQDDWVVLSLRRSEGGKEYLEATVTTGSSDFVQDWVDTINLLFDQNRIHQ